MWTDLSKIKYTGSLKEVDAKALAELNDVSKPQLVEVTGCFVRSKGVESVVFRWVLRDFVGSFLETMGKGQFTCSLGVTFSGVLAECHQPAIHRNRLQHH